MRGSSVPQSFSSGDIEKAQTLLEKIGLTDYEATALSYLLALGESKASEIVEVSDVPSAKIYETLNELFRRGMVDKKPGRPTRYLPKPPTAIIDVCIQEKQQQLEATINKLEQVKQEFTTSIEPLWKKGKRDERHHPLLRILKVGDPSERETNNLLRSAENEILIFSKAFEYYPEVRQTLKKALEENVYLRMILYAPDQLTEEEKKIQQEIIETMQQTLPSNFTINYAEKVPLRGTIVDPGIGKGAVFLVEERGVPLFLREAAATSNKKLVKALAHYFALFWQTLEK